MSAQQLRHSANRLDTVFFLFFKQPFFTIPFFRERGLHGPGSSKKKKYGVGRGERDSFLNVHN